MANVRAGGVCFPAPIRAFCAAAGWNLFRVTIVGDHRLDLTPVLPGDESQEYHSSLSDEGVLWIPAALRERVALAEQSVMMRVESGGVSVYLRKVFETLGFRP